MPRPGALSTADVPAALLDDAVDRGQAEPGALARLLRREERLEQVRLERLRSMPSPVSRTASST